MKKKTDVSSDFSELRHRAELQHSQSHAQEAPPRTEMDTQRLVHELQVHQIELEMQNEELRQAQAEVNNGLERYTDLYDFAPVGYFTLEQDGIVSQVNLCGARLLGVDRSQLVGRRFGLFVGDGDRSLFNAFLGNVFESKVNKTCEVILNKQEGNLRASVVQPGEHKVGMTDHPIVQIEAIAAEHGKTCRAVVIDITENRNLRDRLRASEEKYRKLFLNLPVSTFEVAYENNTLMIVNANYQALQTYGDLVILNSDSLLERIFAPDRKQDIEIIKKQSSRILRMAFESNHVHSDGTAFPVRINISFDSELSSSHYILIIEDITLEKNRRSEEIAISEERARMAREIHDGIAQDLASLKMRTDYWKELIVQDPQNFTAEIVFIENILDKDIQDMRRSIFALRPLTLETEGFFPSIIRYVTDFGVLNKITSHLFVCEDLTSLAEDLELSMFRIIQEGLNNVAKHSKAKNVWISFKNNTEREITIEILDDGVGFNVPDLKGLQRQGHFGLSQMQERVSENHGKFEIISENSNGVSIKISLPLREKLA